MDLKDASTDVGSTSTRPRVPLGSHDLLEEASGLLTEKSVVFLVGCPRSGTTWLQLLLARSPSVVSSRESHLFSSYLRSAFDTWRKHRDLGKPNLGLQGVLTEAEFGASLRQVVSVVFAGVGRSKPTATVILDKTPGHALFAENILKVLPEAHFIHIVRDPRAVVNSLLATAKTPYGEDWAPRTAAAASELWIEHVTKARAIKALTTRYYELRYRDLHFDGPRNLADLFRWIGVDTSVEQCQRYFEECQIENLQQGHLSDAPFDMEAMGNTKGFFRTGRLDSWRHELPFVQRVIVERMTAPLMKQFGFPAPNSLRGLSIPNLGQLTLALRAVYKWRVNRVAEVVRRLGAIARPRK